jgi:hypothetical protein
VLAPLANRGGVYRRCRRQPRGGRRSMRAVRACVFAHRALSIHPLMRHVLFVFCMKLMIATDMTQNNALTDCAYPCVCACARARARAMYGENSSLTCASPPPPHTHTTYKHRHNAKCFEAGGRDASAGAAAAAIGGQRCACACAVTVVLLCFVCQNKIRARAHKNHCTPTSVTKKGTNVPCADQLRGYVEDGQLSWFAPATRDALSSDRAALRQGVQRHYPVHGCCRHPVGDAASVLLRFED